MSCVKVRLRSPLTRAGYTLPAGRETLMDCAVAAVAASRGDIEVLDDTPEYRALRDEYARGRSRASARGSVETRSDVEHTTPIDCYYRSLGYDAHRRYGGYAWVK